MLEIKSIEFEALKYLPKSSVAIEKYKARYPSIAPFQMNEYELKRINKRRITKLNDRRAKVNIQIMAGASIKKRENFGIYSFQKTNSKTAFATKVGAKFGETGFGKAPNRICQPVGLANAPT